MLYRGRLINAMPQSPRVLVNPNHDLDASEAALRRNLLIGPALGPVFEGNIRGF